MPLYIYEACNLFVGDDGPNNSKHLTLESLKLPSLEEISQDHYAGGAVGEISIGGLGLRKLEATFKCKGFDPQILSQFGLGSRNRLPYTAYGVIRDKQGNRAIELKSVLEARLGKVEADDHRRGDLVGHDYMLHEIVHYEVYFDGKEKIYYDFFASEWRIDGASQNADVRNILRIPGEG